MLVEKPIFLCISNPGDMVESFVDALDGLATQDQTQIKLKILEIGSSLSKIFFSFFNQRSCCKEAVIEFEDECIEEKEQDTWRELLQTQKDQFLICTITWKDIATFFLSSSSPSQNKALI